MKNPFKIQKGLSRCKEGFNLKTMQFFIEALKQLPFKEDVSIKVLPDQIASTTMMNYYKSKATRQLNKTKGFEGFKLTTKQIKDDEGNHKYFLVYRLS